MGQCKVSGELAEHKEAKRFSQICSSRVPGVPQQCQWEHIVGVKQQVNLKG